MGLRFDPVGGGMFKEEGCIGFAGVTDGTSNTAAFSERIIGDLNPSVFTPGADAWRGANRASWSVRNGVPRQSVRAGGPAPAQVAMGDKTS